MGVLAGSWLRYTMASALRFSLDWRLLLATRVRQFIPRCLDAFFQSHRVLLSEVCPTEAKKKKKQEHTGSAYMKRSRKYFM